MPASIITALLALASSVVLLTASAWLITTAAHHPPLSELALGITAVRAAGIGRAVFRYLERLSTHAAALDALNNIRVKLYRAALNSINTDTLLHDLTVAADQRKDFVPRVVVPITAAVVLNLISTVICWQSIGLVALSMPAALISTVLIARLIDDNEINDGEYRKALLDFNDGREEIVIADSFERVRAILDKHANQLSTVEQNKIINADSISALINVGVMCLVLSQLIERMDMVGVAVHLMLLLINVETMSAIPSAIRLSKKLLKVEGATLAVKIKTIGTSNPIIEIKDLSFGYDGRTIIDGLNLSMLRADRTAIVGESGSGKTTLLNLMTGLLTPDAGSISINGTLAAATSTNYIFSRSIRDNFTMLNPNVDEQTMIECLKVAQLDEIDLDVELGLDGARLSGGQRCRLQTALALASKADVLILDEPTAGLDRSTADRLIDALLDRSETLIVITHDPVVANKFKLVYRLQFDLKRAEPGEPILRAEPDRS